MVKGTGINTITQKTKTNLFFGSAHAHVPVKPVCPTTSAGASAAQGLFASFSCQVCQIRVLYDLS